MTAALCLAIWCAFGSPVEGDARLLFGQDVLLKNERTERLVLLETYSVFAGFVLPQVAVAGVLPLRIGAGRFHFDGGASVASAPIPLHGTRANWVARAQLQLFDALSLDYLHFSNSGSGRPNPSLDALALGWRF